MARSRVIASTASMTDMFQKYLMSEIPGVEVVKEHMFHYTRKWRFDYAIPDLKIAIEIDGSVWEYGRHNRPQGYINDMEKLNNAASQGWLVLRFTTHDRLMNATLSLIKKTVELRMKEDESNGKDEAGMSLV